MIPTCILREAEENVRVVVVGGREAVANEGGAARGLRLQHHRLFRVLVYLMARCDGGITGGRNTRGRPARLEYLAACKKWAASMEEVGGQSERQKKRRRPRNLNNCCLFFGVSTYNESGAGSAGGLHETQMRSRCRAAIKLDGSTSRGSSGG